MEEVAGTAEKLAKDKVTAPPPPPFRRRATQSIYSRVYSEDGKEARNKRAEQRRLRVTGIEKLGEEEYKKLLEEIDRMTQTPVDMQELINKRMKEIAERLEAEGKEKEVPEQRKTRPRTSTETRPTTRSSTTRRQPEKVDPRQKSKGKRSDQIDDDDDDVSKSRKLGKRAKRSKIIEDDDDLEMIMEKADEIEEPEEEEDDKEMYQKDDEDDDDDFQEPPPRSRKTTSKMPTTERRVEKSTEKTADTEDETLALFQRIVGPEFEVRASQEFEDDPKDRCGNPEEAAGFRATMKMLVRELKDAVKKGKNIEETYTDLIKSTMEVAKAMKYPGATTVELRDVLKSVKDLKCSAWRKYLKGEKKMEPTDVELDDEEPERDLVIQGPILGKEATNAAAEAICNLPPMLLTDTKRQLKNLFEHTMQAHQHAAEASKCLKELHEQLPLEVFLRIADTAVRPLVVLHIPQAEQVIEKLKETVLKKTQERKRTGSTEVIDVMISRNLLQRVAKWTEELEYRPIKMIASIVYKYVREAMFEPKKTVTQAIVDEFGLPKTTIHRQLFGKKYPGVGQTLEKLRSQDRKVEATGSGPRKIAVILKKLKTVTEQEPPAKKTKTITEKDPPPKRVEATGSEKAKLTTKKTKTTTEGEPPSKKGKGPGKKSGKERTAEDIRGAATAESEKRKREAQKRKAQEEEEEFDEDPDKPTKAEIRASKPASKRLFIH